MRQFLALFKRDISIFYKSKSIFILAIIFFLLVTVMLPIGIGPDLKILRSISPGLVWIAFLLSTLLNMPLLFTDDFKDGSLDVIIIESDNPILSILSKILSFWEDKFDKNIEKHVQFLKKNNYQVFDLNF